MILNVYKPKNWTSYDVVAKIKGIFKEQQLQKFHLTANSGFVQTPLHPFLLKAPKKLKLVKIGHAGTLDPLAQGVLIVLTGADTKKQDFIMHQTKEYITEIAFGATTPTFDLEMTPQLGEVCLDIKQFTEKIDALIPQFVGKITQEIPAFSAKKIQGTPMYKAAREGKMDKLLQDKLSPTKEVNIFEFEKIETYFSNLEVLSESGKISEVSLPVLKCRISCSSGTYVRALASEMGRILGCGAVLINLTRTKVGEFEISKSISLDEVARMTLV